MTIADELQNRGINELLHFTTHRGVVGTIAKGALLSRYMLPEENYLQHILHLNAADRPEASVYFDKSNNWLNFVNLSISEINRRYFIVSSEKWHINANVWWCILAFDPIIATHDGVYFTTTNNSYELCKREHGLIGFNNIFSPVIGRKEGWRAHRAQRGFHLPTCEQAEVLYPEQIPLEYLRSIYVRDEEHHDLVKGCLLEYGWRNVNVYISKEKFLGAPN